MQCNFKITNGAKNLSNNTFVYSITAPCFAQNQKIPPLLQSYLSENKLLYLDSPNKFKSAIYAIQNFGKGGKNVDLFPNKGSATFYGIADTYGEYNIAIDEINYYQCTNVGNRLIWKQGEGLENRCVTPFAVTDSYVVQKTPAGNLLDSTNKLQQYKSADGKTFKEILEKAIGGSDEHGAATSEMQKAVFEFKNKYTKLALNATKTPFISSANSSKVPNQDIYFTKGVVRLTGENIKVPTTIIADQDVIVYGNVNKNLMIITEGKVIFGATNCTTSQVIKGIFYAEK